jgi:Helicase associated domain
MTDKRIRLLEDLGFVWDSHSAAWEDRLRELEDFKSIHKHCNVPSNYRANSSLASWIKCQRRQYRLFREGKKSNMTPQRVEQLERMGFRFNLRLVGSSGSDSPSSVTSSCAPVSYPSNDTVVPMVVPPPLPSDFEWM